MEWRLSSRATPRPEEAFACGIAVDEEDFEALEREASGKIDGGGGLAHSPLLIDDAENLSHSVSG